MKDFKKYYLIPASPEEVYQALTNPLTIELWTNEAAEMKAEPGTEFSMWDGSISGKNLSFVPNKQIEQQWYFGDQEEASIVLIKLHPDKRGCSVEVRHTNIPDADFEDISAGWTDSYFGPLQFFFADK